MQSSIHQQILIKESYREKKEISKIKQYNTNIIKNKQICCTNLQQIALIQNYQQYISFIRYGHIANDTIFVKLW